MNDMEKELNRKVTKLFNGVNVVYEEVYYLDHDVDDETGIIDKEKLVPYYTKDQVNRNMKALKLTYSNSK